MTWAKLDDQFHAHRKAKRAWKAHPRALGLHLLAISYCAGQLSDGFVDVEFVEEKVPVDRERPKVTDALEHAGLWAPVEGGWQINDWLDYNPSREEVERRRESDRKRKREQGKRGAESRWNPNGFRAESETTPGGVQAASMAPVPSRPDPLPPRAPKGARKRDLASYETALVEWAAAHGITGDKASVVRAASQCPEGVPFLEFCHQFFPSLTRVPVGLRAVPPEKDAPHAA